MGQTIREKNTARVLEAAGLCLATRSRRTIERATLQDLSYRLG